jgi:hypothetical protein
MMSLCTITSLLGYENTVISRCTLHFTCIVLLTVHGKYKTTNIFSNLLTHWPRLYTAYEYRVNIDLIYVYKRTSRISLFIFLVQREAMTFLIPYIKEEELRFGWVDVIYGYTPLSVKFIYVELDNLRVFHHFCDVTVVATHYTLWNVTSLRVQSIVGLLQTDTVEGRLLSILRR